jgi:hypothetical protein
VIVLSKPADIAGAVETPYRCAEGLVETGRRPLPGKICMHNGRNGLPDEDELHSRLAAKSRVTMSRPLELGLIDWSAEFSHESLH